MSEVVSVKLKKVKFTQINFGQLSKNEKVLLSLLTYVVSETNALWRIFLCAFQSTIGSEPVDASVAIQRHVLLRTWSAKLFEFDKALKDLRQRPKIDPTLKDFVEGLRKRISKEENRPPDLALLFRNEASNHASVSAALKNLPFLASDVSLNMYFHPEEANSVFPLGEEVFFAARYNRYLAENSKEPKSIEAFQGWLEWNQGTTRELMYFLDEFLTQFVFHEKCELEWEDTILQLDPVFVGDYEKSQIPIFLQRGTQ